MHTGKLLDSPAALLPFPLENPWGKHCFLGLIHAVALVGTPWYIATHAVSTAEWAIFGIYMLATGFSITVGYHRLFAHAAFRKCASPFPRPFLRRCRIPAVGAQGHPCIAATISWWIPPDPYNIKQGFCGAHGMDPFLEARDRLRERPGSYGRPACRASAPSLSVVGDRGRCHYPLQPDWPLDIRWEP